MKVIIEPRYAVAEDVNEDEFYPMMDSALRQIFDGELKVSDFLSWLDLDIAGRSDDDRRYIFEITFTPTMDEKSNDTVMSIDWKTRIKC